jgi:hypothetical protein
MRKRIVSVGLDGLENARGFGFLEFDSHDPIVWAWLLWQRAFEMCGDDGQKRGAVGPLHKDETLAGSLGFGFEFGGFPGEVTICFVAMNTASMNADLLGDGIEEHFLKKHFVDGLADFGVCTDGALSHGPDATMAQNFTRVHLSRRKGMHSEFSG